MKRPRDSIRYRFSTLLISLFAMMAVLTVLSSWFVNDLLTKNTTSYATSAIQRREAEIDQLFSSIDDILLALTVDSDMANLMLSPNDPGSIERMNRISIRLSSYAESLGAITSSNIVSSTFCRNERYSTAALREYDRQLENRHDIVSFGIQTVPTISKKYVLKPQLIFARNVFDSKANKLGSLILFIDPTQSAVWSDDSNENGGIYLLMDNSGNTFSLTGSAKNYDEILAECGALFDSSVLETEMVETSDHFVYITPLSDYDYRLVSIFDKTALKQDSIQTQSWMIAIIISAFFFLIILMNMVLRHMVVPLEKLTSHLQDIKKSAEEKIQLPEPRGCSEIRELTHSYYELFQKETELNANLHQATVNLYEMKLGKQQAELDFLRSQINPHFLYNTLESIKDIAIEENVPQISVIANAIAKLFRYNVKGPTNVSLGQELEVTQAYLSIQQIRFPEKIVCAVMISESLHSLDVIKFILPPIVENAFYHGLEPKKGEGTLFIGAKLQDGDLCITVQDDGVGMPPDQLQTLQQQLEVLNDKGGYGHKHVGLLNVHHRILLTYGKPYGISIESELGRGTKVIMRIPAPASTDERKDERG